MMMNFKESPEFFKEFKKLAKKYISLPDDLENFKKVITAMPLGNGKHFHVIGRKGECTVIKARLFCRYLKGSSLRIVYSYFKNEFIFEFIEVYYKGDKENENRERIKDYLK